MTRPPWCAAYLIPTGWLVFPVVQLASGTSDSPWAVGAVLLCLLLGLRLGTALVRPQMPFSPAVQTAWAESRTLCKRYDSYQWQKLLWVGLGICLYAASSARWQTLTIVLAAACLGLGGLGAVVWQRTQKTDSQRIARY